MDDSKKLLLLADTREHVRKVREIMSRDEDMPAEEKAALTIELNKMDEQCAAYEDAIRKREAK